MPSDKGYLDYILEQCGGTGELTWRAMMGEYILYYNGRVVGGVYDDRLLIKPTPAAVALMPDAVRERPYEGAKEMLLVDRVDDPAFLRRLLPAVAAEVPAPKKRA